MLGEKLTDSIFGLLVSALLNDECHHKQWLIQKSMDRLFGTERMELFREDLKRQGYEWEDGIAP
jgi:hypothetical protein